MDKKRLFLCAFRKSMRLSFVDMYHGTGKKYPCVIFSLADETYSVAGPARATWRCQAQL